MKQNRVLGRTGARELTYYETEGVSGAVRTTVCTAPPPTVTITGHGDGDGCLGDFDHGQP